MTKQQFVAILKAAGITEEQMQKLHVEFERASGEEHARFLAFLNIDAKEIAEIRAWSQKG